jgi:hypothetical protein
MRIILFFIVVSISSLTHATIFGTDDRQEPENVSGAVELAQSIAMMQSDIFVKYNSADNNYDLDFPLATYELGANMCSDEKFSDQHVGYINCTGFLVAEDVIVTAGHCMIYSHNPLPKVVVEDQTTAMCDSFLWMFDYQKTANKNEQLTDISADSVYRCEKVIYAELFGYSLDQQGELLLPIDPQLGQDFAIIKLDRKVKGRKPLSLSNTPLGLMEYVSLMGYPMAMPIKYTGNAQVINTTYSNYLLTDLDVIGGNSGGPVFNSQQEVIGVAVRSFPGEDYVYDEQLQCSRNYTCKEIGKGDCTDPLNHPIGAHVNRIQPVIAKLKELGIIF